LALEMFRQIESAEEVELLAEKMLTHADLTFRHRASNCVSDVPSVVLFLKGAATILRHKKNVRPEFVAEFADISDKLSRRFAILREFGLKTTESDLDEPNVSKRVRDLIEVESKNLESTQKKLQRLSHLFNYPFESCVGQLLFVLSEKKNYIGFVRSVREFFFERNLNMTPDLSRLVQKSISCLHRSLIGKKAFLLRGSRCRLQY
jgi:hypothetical protein